VESFGAEFFDPDYLASRREKLRQMRESAGAADDDVPDIQDLWFIEERTDVAAWLTEHCWDVTSVEAAELMTRYGRREQGDVDEASPRTVFVEAHLTG
jgi:O-methyltransferase involved in polyketide biosynthesis